MSRGKERMVTCEQCGRQIRRDKAVFIEKPVFNNPLDRSEVVDEYYTRTLMREFAYCPSCGKHFRIYQKKKQMMERQRERQRMAQFHGGQGGPRRSGGPQRYKVPNQGQPAIAQPAAENVSQAIPAEGEASQGPTVVESTEEKKADDRTN